MRRNYIGKIKNLNKIIISDPSGDNEEQASR